MKYSYPCSINRLTQGFGFNPELYKPLKGHPAYDFGFNWNEPIPFIADSYVYSKINENNSDPSLYTGVCTIVKTGKDTADEIIYGHPNAMPVQVGLTYKKGETCALAGNKGLVYSNGRKVTKEERLKGSRAGTHLHLQRRPCKLVKNFKRGKKYLKDAKGNFKKDGYYYEIVDYDNGFKGCEPIPWDGSIAIREKGLVPYEEAVENLRRSGLTEPVLSMALWVLKNKYGK